MSRFSLFSDMLTINLLPIESRAVIFLMTLDESAHRCRSRQILGGAKDFCPNFLKCVWKDFVRLLRPNIFPQRSWRPFFGVTSSKRSSCVFVQTLGAIFWSQTTLGAIFARIFRDFAQVFRDFAQIFRDIAQIFRDFARIFREFARILNKAKLFGERWHPRNLHHWINHCVALKDKFAPLRYHRLKKLVV